MTAKRFLAAGAKVAAWDIDETALASFLDEFPTATAIRCDVGDAVAVADTVQIMMAAMGCIDILVNNAGSVGPTAFIEDITPGDWASTMDINLFSQFLFINAVVPVIKTQKSGAIINMSSVQAVWAC